MKTPIGFLALLAINASALPIPDVMCRPQFVADNGYSVSLVRTEEGYLGHLNTVRIYGEQPLFRGPVKMEAYLTGDQCKLIVTNPIARCGTERCIGPESFTLEMTDQTTKLLTVGGKQVGDPGSTMICSFSPEFLADKKALCADF